MAETNWVTGVKNNLALGVICNSTYNWWWGPPCSPREHQTVYKEKCSLGGNIFRWIMIGERVKESLFS